MPSSRCCVSVTKQMIGASISPELATFNLLLALAAEKKAKGSAVELFELMEATDDSKPDEKTFGAMINCSWACNDIKLATQYLKQMLDGGFTPPVAAINALLGSCKDSALALEIVKIVQSSTLASLDSASYTQLIRCACGEGDLDLGGRVLQQALHAGVEVEEPAVTMLVETGGGIDLEKTMQILQLLMAGG